MDIFNQSLKDELAYQKKVEDQLRKEVRELKLKLSDPKPREERLAFERKMEELKAISCRTSSTKCRNSIRAKSKGSPVNFNS
jgi:hypothetical protein